MIDKELNGRGDAVYKQIDDSLRGKINHGEWRPGTMLPGRRELAKLFGVSRLTMERAVTGLIADGVLRADNRRGTFVAETNSATRAHGRALHFQDASPRPSGGLTIGIVGSLYESRHDHLELNNHWVRLLIHTLESESAHDNNRSCFFNRVKSSSTPAQPLDKAVAEACDGGIGALAVIGLGAQADEIERTLAVIGKQNDRMPIVVISAEGALERPLPHVFYDNYGAGYEAAKHLLAAGCHRLMVFAPTTGRWAAERIAGVRAALLHTNTSVDLVVAPEHPEPWRQDEEPTELAYQRARDLMQTTPFPDGVICLQDQGAFGLIRAADEIGLVPGRDFAVIGFDDNPHSRTIRLSTMRPPIETMGTEAARLLRMALRGEPVNRQVNLSWRLIARASTERRSANGA